MEDRKRILTRVSASAQKLKRTFSEMSADVSPYPTTPASALQTAITRISFPDPTFPDRPSLLQMPESWRHDAAKSFLQHADELRKSSTEILRSTFAKLLKLYPVEQYLVITARLFESRLQQYSQDIRKMEDHLITQSLRYTSQPTLELSNPSASKSTFKSEFTPLLERYFSRNAYPSAPDRVVLAKKTGMTVRQIEVWFQNHRNRAKKEGKLLPRIPNQAMKLPQRAASPLPVDHRHSRRSELLAHYTPPQGVFPSEYRKCQDLKRDIPTYTWPRLPSSRTPRHAPINVDQLIDNLSSGLHLWDNTTGLVKRKGRPPPCRFLQPLNPSPIPQPTPTLLRSDSRRPTKPLPSVRALPSARSMAYRRYESATTIPSRNKPIAEASLSSASLLPLLLASCQSMSSAHLKHSIPWCAAASVGNFSHQLEHYMLPNTPMPKPLHIIGRS